MLDQKDLEMIKGIVVEAIEPTRAEVRRLDKKIDDVQARIDQRLDKVDQRLDAMDRRFDTLQANVESNTRKIQSLETKVTKTQLILENEVLPNIRLLADGYHDLSRKMDEMLERERKRDEEMIPLRVSILESEVRKLKLAVST